MAETEKRHNDKTYTTYSPLGGHTLARFISTDLRTQLQTQINFEPKQTFNSVGEAKRHFSTLYRTSRRWTVAGLYVLTSVGIEHFLMPAHDQAFVPLEAAIFLSSLAITLKRGLETAKYGQLLRDVRMFEPPDIRDFPKHRVFLKAKESPSLN